MSKSNGFVQFLCEYCDAVGCTLSELTPRERNLLTEAFNKDMMLSEVLNSEAADEPEDDGQPSEYDEWQDYMGGDDWDHGQYDEGL